ncbi:unnamed protein product, partial [Iphiclides podalirius]
MFVFATNGQIVPKNPLESNILSFLKKWQAGSTTDVLPIPSLKTVKIPPVEYYYEGRGLKLDYSIGEMLLIGLDRFTIENIAGSVKALEVSLTLRFPVLTLASESYKIKGWAYYLYPLRGSGRMQLIFRDSVITAKARFGKTKDAGTTMQNFLLTFDVKKIEATLENSFWPINRILNSEGVEILEGYRGTIAEALRSYVVPTVNDYLAKVPYAQFLQIAS